MSDQHKSGAKGETTERIRQREYVRWKKACPCEHPDPVMQADGKFYCHACSFETGARPAFLEPESIIRAAEARADAAEQENKHLRLQSDEFFKTVAAVLEDAPLESTGEYVHVITCNASRSQPVGNDMCSCPIGRRIEASEQARAALAQKYEPQPIATAPEATYVLVQVPNYGWRRALKTTHPSDGAIWWTCATESEIVNPTHWAPEPTPRRVSRAGRSSHGCS